jgi:glycosyltransferase involved in cell wall biosynthesis
MPEQSAARYPTGPTESDASGPLFTVFVPTYNRAGTLRRTLDSVAAQTCRDFELLIIDDGSSDRTPTLVAEWRQHVAFPVYYIQQENEGQHAAHNRGVTEAHGELFVKLDSDDALTPRALEILRHHWESIPTDERDVFAGVEGLTAFFDGTVAGTKFPWDVVDSDYVTLRRQHRIKGDKKNALRTDLLRQWPYPRYEGERHMRPSWLLKNLARTHRTRYVNEVIEWIEYQPDGLSSDRFMLRMRNPNSYRQYHLEDVNVHSGGKPLKERITACASYIRYSRHAGVSWWRTYHAIDERWLWWLSLPAGLAKWVADARRMRREGVPRPPRGA